METFSDVYFFWLQSNFYLFALRLSIYQFTALIRKYEYSTQDKTWKKCIATQLKFGSDMSV